MTELNDLLSDDSLLRELAAIEQFKALSRSLNIGFQILQDGNVLVEYEFLATTGCESFHYPLELPGLNPSTLILQSQSMSANQMQSLADTFGLNLKTEVELIRQNTRLRQHNNELDNLNHRYTQIWTENLQANEKLQEYSDGLETKVFEKTRELKEALARANIANEAKSRFLANISHELRTPLNGVIALTQLTLTTELDSEQRENLDIVERSARTLLTILNDILDFSKIEAGKIRIEREPFPLLQTLQDVVDSIRPMAESKDLQFAVTAFHPLPETVIGDSLRLSQVLFNLAGNAVKFTHEGRIELRVELQRRENSLNFIQFFVEDTRIGIDSERLESIFEPFTQADDSTSRRFGGTGLGIAIARELVELMGGELHVQSQKNQGSVFTFTLPLLQTAQKEPPLKIPHLSVCDLPFHILPWVQNWTQNLEFVQPQDLLGVGDSPLLISPNAYWAQRHQLDQWNSPIAILGRPQDLQPNKLKPHIQTLRTPCLPHKIQRWLNSLQSPNHTHEITQKPISEPYGVLIIEDNPINRRTVEKLVRYLGYSVKAVSSARAGVQSLEYQTPDLVLMDLMMPEMDGFEACRELRRRGLQSPVIAMSALNPDTQKEPCEASGMDGFLAKPIVIEELKNLLATFLNNSSDANKGSQEAQTALMNLSNGEPSFINEMMDLFLKTAPSELAQMREGFAQGHWETIRKTSHSLKNSIGIVGQAEDIRQINQIHKTLTAPPSQIQEQTFHEQADACAQIIQRIQSRHSVG